MTTTESICYSAAGFQNIYQAESAEEAASIFARREARRRHGRAGQVITLCRDNWAPDGSSWTFEASIGTRAVGGGYTVNSFWVTVHVR